MPLERLGLVKTSLSDYPGRVAAVLFTHGCNMECGWCHNPTLVRDPPADFYTLTEVLERFRLHGIDARLRA
jgi:pyruvate formate lyase activating enzyme